MSKPLTLSERVEALVPHAEDCLLHANIVALVRSERRRVVRLVTQLKAAYGSHVMFSRGYRRACDDVLAAIKERT